LVEQLQLSCGRAVDMGPKALAAATPALKGTGALWAGAYVKRRHTWHEAEAVVVDDMLRGDYETYKKLMGDLIACQHHQGVQYIMKKMLANSGVWWGLRRSPKCSACTECCDAALMAVLCCAIIPHRSCTSAAPAAAAVAALAHWKVMQHAMLTAHRHLSTMRVGLAACQHIACMFWP
jgi:hypothetical protein